MGHFNLQITNRTGDTMNIVEYENFHGCWVVKPQSIEDGETLSSALKIESCGFMTQYSFESRWQGEVNSNNTFWMKVHVPYIGTNTSEIISGGDLIVEGWEDLPSSGADFERQITFLTVNEEGEGDGDQ